MIRERLFGWWLAFDHPVTLWMVVGIGALLVLARASIWLLAWTGKVDADLRAELVRRWNTWAVLVPLVVGAILLGAAWWIGLALVLSLLCLREYARATGLFREKWIHAVVVLGVLLVYFAVLDHWYGFFVALVPLLICVIAATAILADRPKGYIQRVALGIFGFALFGSAFAHLGYMANDAGYRPILLMILLAVELNDVFAYVVGKSLGRRKLAPNTSPNKTVAGSAGAVLLTSPLVAFLGHWVFARTDLDTPARLVVLGLIVSAVGQIGDLMLSSIKRDLGIKDTGAVLPGHGGFLDRFDSLILVAPAVFHYVGYYVGFGLDQPTRILTGG